MNCPQRPTGCRDSSQANVGHRNNNNVPRGPGASEKGSHLADDNRLSPTHRSLLEFSLTEEGDPVAVWREKREDRSFRVRNGNGLKLVEAPDIQVRKAAIDGNVGHAFTVGREHYCLGHVSGQFLFRWQAYVQPYNPMLTISVRTALPQQKKCEHEHRGGQRGKSHNPCISLPPQSRGRT